MEADEQVVELLGADRDHCGETDRGIHRVTAADPIPKPEHVGRVDAERGDFFGIRGDGHEMLGDCLNIAAQSLKDPLTRALRIRHGLERREGLRGDDEECLGRIEIAHRLGEVGPVDIGDEAECQFGIAVVAERLVGHDGPEVGSPDSHIDDVFDFFPSEPLPLAVTDAVGKGTHRLEDLVDLGDHIDTIDLDHLSPGSTEGDMENGTTLGDVDLLPGEHLVAVLLESSLLGELDKKGKRLVGDAVLRVVEVETAGLGGKSLTTGRISGEEFLEGCLGDLVAVFSEGFPGGELGGVLHGERMN